MADTNKLLNDDISKKLWRIALKTAGFIKVNLPIKTGKDRNSVVTEKPEEGYWRGGYNLSYMEYIE